MKYIKLTLNIAHQLLSYFVQYYEINIENISMSKVQEFVNLIILINFNGDFLVGTEDPKH